MRLLRILEALFAAALVVMLFFVMEKALSQEPELWLMRVKTYTVLNGMLVEKTSIESIARSEAECKAKRDALINQQREKGENAIGSCRRYGDRV